MAQLQQYRGGYYLWNYVPSLAGAVIFILLLLTTAALHFWRLFRTRTWFCLPFAIGCFAEAIGYCARAGAVNKTGKLMPYILQNFFILVSPALFAASIYMTLGRIMRYVKGEHHSIIRIGWLTKTFVLGDVLSFMVQGGSAGLMFQSSTIKLGEDIVLVGLFIQIISFGLFFVSAVLFQIRIRKNPTQASFNVEATWERNLYMLYVVSVLILIRSIFRVVEYIQGQSGYSLKHEWTLYVFDSVPMFIVTVVYFVWYPSRVQARPGGLTEESMGIPMRVDTERHEPKIRN